MNVVKDLTGPQIEDCLAEAVRRDTPVALSCRDGEGLSTLRTRLLRHEGERLVLERPQAEGAAPDIVPGLHVGLAFKLRHHKHIFNAVVESVESVGGAVRVGVPSQMQRIQRRAYQRVEVPRNRSVLATFWMGGTGGRHSGPRDPAVTWEGWVTNLSAGGFQARLSFRSVPALEVGDAVGVRLDLGQELGSVIVDAQFRHSLTDERGVTLMGFAIIGLSETPEGRAILDRIGRVVHEFQRVETRRRGQRG